MQKHHFYNADLTVSGIELSTLNQFSKIPFAHKTLTEFSSALMAKVFKGLALVQAH